MKKITLIFVALFSFGVVIAHGDDDHYKNYSSQAKTMIAKGESYHKNVDVVRRMHPIFMKHKRDKTLREGVRSEEASLKGCVNCHGGFDENGKAMRIDAEGQFCSDCHEKVGTTVDCFSCHKATSSN